MSGKHREIETDRHYYGIIRYGVKCLTTVLIVAGHMSGRLHVAFKVGTGGFQLFGGQQATNQTVFKRKLSPLSLARRSRVDS